MGSARIPLYRTGNLGVKSRAGGDSRLYLLRRVRDSRICWICCSARCGAAAGGSGARHPRRQVRGDELRVGGGRARRVRQGRWPGRPLRALEARARGAAGAAGRAHGAARRRRGLPGRRAVRRQRLVVRRCAGTRDRAVRAGHGVAPARPPAYGRSSVRDDDRSRRVRRAGRDRVTGPRRGQGVAGARSVRRGRRSARGRAVRARVRSPAFRHRGCSSPTAGRWRSCPASTPARPGWRSSARDGRSGSAASGTRRLVGTRCSSAPARRRSRTPESFSPAAAEPGALGRTIPGRA